MTDAEHDFEPLDLRSAWDVRPPDLEFALPGLCLGTVGNVVATGGTGKTFLMLATSIGVAVGADAGDLWGVDPIRGSVVYVGLEDPDAVLRSRLWALRELVPPEARQFAYENLSILALAGRSGTIAKPSASELKPTPWFDALAERVALRKPRLVVFDTLNRLLGGVSENDAGPMGAVIGRLEALARDARCAVVVCHHVSKAASSGRNAEEAHAARGSSVITDNARWQVNLTRPTGRDERYAGIADDERSRLVRMEVTKSSYGPSPPERWLRRGPDGVLRGCGRPEGLDDVEAVATAKKARTLGEPRPARPGRHRVA